MASNAIRSVSFVGAGNLATHLALALHQHDVIIKEVWSHQQINAEVLAGKLNAGVCSNLSQLVKEIDLLIIAVKDDALESVIAQIPKGMSAVVHTSGSMEMTTLKDVSPNIGVLYPVQSFKKEEKTDWSAIPICVEANNDQFTKELFGLAESLTNQVEYLNSTQRIQLHMAAIFANNFSNYIYSIAFELALKQHLPFSLLIPLITKTVSRLDNSNPFDLQTGPAMRNDVELIAKHEALLSENPEALEVYRFLSESIIKKGRK